MKRLFISSLLAGFLLAGGVAFAGESAPAELVEYAETTLSTLGMENIIVNAVNTANAKGKTLSQIKEMDDQWKNTAGVTDYMEAIMESECGQFLVDYLNEYDFIAEIFVMDNQGANVAMTDKTSDYWQGDEAKFTESFDAGSGALFIDEVEFDDSVQSYCVQISFPVRDGGKVIGAITIGVDIDRFEESI
jgi:hypothetical protein